MDGKLKRKDGLAFILFEAIISIVIINIGFYLAFLLKFNMNVPSEKIDSLFNIMPLISITVFAVFHILGMFTMLKKSLTENIITIVLSVGVVNIITVGIVFFTKEFSFSRSVIVIAAIVQILILILFKSIVLKVLKSKYKIDSILVVGKESDAKKIVKKLVTDENNLDSVKYLCTSVNDNMYEMIEDSDKIYIGSSIDNETKSKIVSYCIGKSKMVYMVPELFEIALVNSKIVQLDDTLIFKIENLGLSQEKLMIKRSFDIVASFIGIVILSPVMIAVALAIKLYDGGEILFAQERITMGYKKFYVYKFRTMIVDAEKYTGPTLAKDKDNRITPLGRILRMTRLDEIPQLFNVLIGDMSIVGPRPEREVFIEQFEKEIPDFRYRTVVKAGVTGLAQILGKYTTTPEDKLRFDLLYIKRCSLMYDIKIIFKTIRVVFTKASSDGTKDEKALDIILNDLNLKIYEDLSFIESSN